MDPEVVSDVKDSIGMVLDKCMGTSNWEVSFIELIVLCASVPFFYIFGPIYVYYIYLLILSLLHILGSKQAIENHHGQKIWCSLASGSW
jgi:hypothetical protein